MLMLDMLIGSGGAARQQIILYDVISQQKERMICMSVMSASKAGEQRTEGGQLKCHRWSMHHLVGKNQRSKLFYSSTRYKYRLD